MGSSWAKSVFGPTLSHRVPEEPYELWTPDGDLAFSQIDDSSIGIKDQWSGTLLRVIATGLSKIDSLVPGLDGRTLMVRGGFTFERFEISTGRLVHRFVADRLPTGITQCFLTPSGDRVVVVGAAFPLSASGSRWMQLDAQSGAVLAEVSTSGWTPYQSYPRRLEPAGGLRGAALVRLPLSPMVFLLDFQTFGLKPLFASSNEDTYTDISQDGSRLLVSGHYGAAVVDVSTMRPVFEYQPPTFSYREATLTPDGLHLLMTRNLGNSSYDLEVYQVDSGRKILHQNIGRSFFWVSNRYLLGDSYQVDAFDFRTSQSFATGFDSTTLHLKQSHGTPSGFAVSNSSKAFLGRSNGPVVRLDMPRGRVTQSPISISDLNDTNLESNSDGTVVVGIGKTSVGKSAFFRSENLPGAAIRKYVREEVGALSCFDYDPQSESAAVGTRGSEVVFYRGNVNSITRKAISISGVDIESIHAFDAKNVLVGSSEGQLIKINVSSGQIEAQLTLGSVPLISIARNPVADRLAILDQDSVLTICNAATMEIVSRVQLSRNCRKLHWLPNGKILLACDDPIVLSFDPETQQVAIFLSSGERAPLEVSFEQSTGRIWALYGLQIAELPRDLEVTELELWLMASREFDDQVMRETGSVQLRQSGSNVSLNSLQLGKSMLTAQFIGLTSGLTYRLKYPGYLSKVSEVIHLQNSIYFDQPQVRAGDVDDDDEVSIFDYILLSSAFGAIVGESSYLLEADFDRDGEINVFDYQQLSENFGAQGDPW